MIEVKHLYHQYDGQEGFAVEDVSFSIERGEIFGFLGPSGAGKSTTQKILIGLLEKQRGTVTIDGKEIDGQNKERFQEIGVSFEQPNVYKKLSGLENLQFYAGMFRGQTEDPMELLEQVGLLDAAHTKAGQYSKGMLQRLVFARSMINRPKIWFLDEPTSGLDPTTASKIKEIIRQKRDEGVTIFLTTHNMHIAQEICDRVAFITRGRISAIDTPRTLMLKHGKNRALLTYEEEGRMVERQFSLEKEGERKDLAAMIASGRVQTMHTAEATLEDIFIEITGEVLAK